jgi:hypothetical protein
MMSREDLMREEREALVLAPARPCPFSLKMGRVSEGGAERAGRVFDFVFCLGIVFFVVIKVLLRAKMSAGSQVGSKCELYRAFPTCYKGFHLL